MRFFKKRPAHFGPPPLGFLPALALLCGINLCPSAIQAQPSTITNLAQLTQIFVHASQVVREIRLEATVFACDTNTGTMILQDSSGSELLELDGLARDFQPGDVVRMDGGSVLLDPGQFGVYVATAPLLNNDGLHSARMVSREFTFARGRYPLRLDWFNEFSALDLEITCAGANTGNWIHATDAQCFQGNWVKVPNFLLLQPVKTGNVTNFDLAFRTRDEMVGIRFQGYFEAPQTGKYRFSLRSDDGSRLWIGDTQVRPKKIGAHAPPPAPAAVIGESMSQPNSRRLATIQGRVGFVSRIGQGLRLELRSEQNTATVDIADARSLEPADLLNAFVRVSGLAEAVLAEDQRPVLGAVLALNASQLAIIDLPPGRGPFSPPLTTVMQVHSLSAENAARQLPVEIQGVVTAVGQPLDRWMVIQDDMRGTFVKLTVVSNAIPNAGEIWSIAGHTQPGDFAPVIIAEQATLLGKGRLPAPALPSWDQLVNGSMDVQWAELQGQVSAVQSNHLSVIMSGGRQDVRLPGWGESELKPFDKAVVRIRGTLFAVWNPETHEVLNGSLTMHNASVSVEKAPPDDPFDAPVKTPRGLFLFDAKATPFQRVKVRGQVTYADSKRVFVEQGSGIEILPAAGISLQAGDIVEAVGYPEVSGIGPLLREALLRKVGHGVLPAAPLTADSGLADSHLASSRIRIEGYLAGQHTDDDTEVLQIQTHVNLFQARVASLDSLRSLRQGSKLSLTGIYVADARSGAPSGSASHFELLVNGPADIAVISEPSWWTLRRLLSAVGVLLFTLALAAVWITLLRREVAQRTLQLRHEIRERERAERQHALEAERSRIARDLHDDLGSSLTEINVLASTGQHRRSADGSHPALFRAISEKARSLVTALDGIVWAVDPKENSLQSLADYLSGYTHEYMSSSNIACRFKVPVALPGTPLDGQIRHELLMVVKETLNNIIRHAAATEVEFKIGIVGESLEISIVDNGKGFDPKTEPGGHGLKNHAARLTKIGGSCEVESSAGTGTTVRIRLPLPQAAGGQNGRPHTTFD